MKVLLRLRFLCLLSAGIMLFAMSCGKGNETLVRQLLELESPDYQTSKSTDARIEELKAEVRKYKGIVEEKVKATDKLLTYYRMLALAYMDRKMYGPAMEALDQAIWIAPEQPPLFLYRAISAARLAKGVQNAEKQETLFKEAERAYLRCLELDANYGEALYGLSVLYVFEFNAPSRAIPLLTRLLEAQKQHVGAMFLLARSYLSLGKVEDAIAMYDRIIGTNVAGNLRDEARKLKDQVLQGAIR